MAHKIKLKDRHSRRLLKFYTMNFHTMNDKYNFEWLNKFLNPKCTYDLHKCNPPSPNYPVRPRLLN